MVTTRLARQKRIAALRKGRPLARGTEHPLASKSLSDEIAARRWPAPIAITDVWQRQMWVAHVYPLSPPSPFAPAIVK